MNYSNKNAVCWQGSSSPSRSTTSRATVRSMASTSATCSAPATWTQPSRPSPSWEVRARRERRPSSLMTSTRSSSRPRTQRTPAASTTSSRSWSCTTRMRTAPSSKTSSSGCWPTSVINFYISVHESTARNIKLRASGTNFKTSTSNASSVIRLLASD